MLNHLALGGIWAYQRFVSPRKGYACAYRVAYGGTGCSGFAKYAISDHGFWRALPRIRQRFRDCQSAAVMLAERREEEQKKKRDSGCSDYAEYALCGCPGDAGSCRSGKSKAVDGGDCTPDCSLDCMPCGCGN